MQRFGNVIFMVTKKPKKNVSLTLIFGSQKKNQTGTQNER